MGERGLWLIGIDGGTPPFLLSAKNLIDTPTWSPDSGQLAYAVVGGEVPELQVMSLADKRAMKLQTPAGASAPAWSPTGEVIAYLEPQGPNSTRVAFVDRRGRALYTNLPHEPYVEHRASGIDECGGLAEVRAHRLSVARPSSAVSLSNPAGVAVNYSG